MTKDHAVREQAVTERSVEADGLPRTKYVPEVERQTRLTKAEVEAQLESASRSIAERLTSIQSEITSAGRAVKESLTENPWISVAATLVAGIVIGRMLAGGKRRKRSRRKVPKDVRALVVQTFEEAAARGIEPNDAVGQVLDRLVPSVDERKAGRKKRSGVAGGLLRVATGLALNLLVREGLGAVKDRKSESKT
jgi:ElaB/YqjD/DUF883 family membrane-anchored ribosome-binding protein